MEGQDRPGIGKSRGPLGEFPGTGRDGRWTLVDYPCTTLPKTSSFLNGGVLIHGANIFVFDTGVATTPVVHAKSPTLSRESCLLSVVPQTPVVGGYGRVRCRRHRPWTETELESTSST